MTLSRIRSLVLPFLQSQSVKRVEQCVYIGILRKVVSVATTNIPQHVADALFAMEKHSVSDEMILFDRLGQSENIMLVSVDKTEEFYLDLTRGRQSLFQISMQNRAKKDVVLVRLDINGPPHRNPKSKVLLPTPHLHVYRENFGDRWAEPAPTHIFSDLNSELTTLREFLRYCYITKPPNIMLQGGLSI